MRHAYDKLVADQLIALLESGNYISVACRSAGISKTTFYRWLEFGAEYCEAEAAGKPVKAENKVFVEFRRRVEQAKAKAETEFLNKVKAQGEQDWRSIAWIMERRYPKRWGRRDGDGKAADPGDVSIRDAQSKVNADTKIAADVERLASSLSGKLGGA